jgi:hypothetical protein
VTGASSGIGLELARVLARENYNLVLVARSGDKLEALAGELRKRHSVDVLPITMDLWEPDAPDRIFAQLLEAVVTVDLLVNSAGFTVFGRFVETDWRKEAELLQVNIVALTRLTKLFLPGMVERGWGRVLNLASTAAFQPGPLMALYYASKAYVLYFSEALYAELEGTGVSVTALCPGPTESGFQKRGEMEGSRLVAGRRLMSARSVANAGYRALMKGKAVLVPGRSYWLFAQSVRFMPRSLVRRLILRAQQPVQH